MMTGMVQLTVLLGHFQNLDYHVSLAMALENILYLEHHPVFLP